ncbi:hypothetical protein [uncultured Cocleimonas sp.]|uniref:hypothetical protein n=1 Tax=uncultured Cocleimonas sp. TaxID=1051587 RepID=UPI002606DD0F|nr:hypothetical protein [uncultured Cocleimonas sp.]
MKSFSQLNNKIIISLKLLLLSGLLLVCGNASAIAITPDLEVQKISGVGSSPSSVTFENTTYTNPIPVCTYNIPSRSANPATVRIQNLTNSGMSIYLQGSDGAVTAGDVHCIIAQEGGYTSAVDGIEFEARSVVSDETNGSGRWQNSRLETVRDTNAATTDLVTGTYASPVVVGQVISSNDTAFSTFWTNNCSSRQTPPNSNNMCIGKHNGKLGAGAEPTSSETIGFMVFERQTATTAQVNNIHYTALLGGDAVAGVTNNPPHTYNLPNSYNYEFGIASQNAEDGGDGSWAVLYGADPLAAGNMDLAVDETDAPNRGHTNEQVVYVAFAMSELTLEKTVITNNGGTAVDANFTLSYAGSSSASGIEGSTAVTKATILPGTYALSETNIPGYTASAWSCTGGTLVGSNITLVIGDDVTCTITNDDNPARLTISKTITTDDGVVATLADFNVAVNGTEVPWSNPSSTTGGSEIVTTSAGTYTLSEIDFASYAEGSWSCIDDNN